tara:strand:+ start:708 stop:962 length:255 start_codon:yes stop_codon:yes gene_type:complete
MQQPSTRLITIEFTSELEGDVFHEKIMNSHVGGDWGEVSINFHKMGKDNSWVGISQTSLVKTVDEDGDYINLPSLDSTSESESS